MNRALRVLVNSMMRWLLCRSVCLGSWVGRGRRPVGCGFSVLVGGDWARFLFWVRVGMGDLVEWYRMSAA